jgi:hypothetical protein
VSTTAGGKGAREDDNGDGGGMALLLLLLLMMVVLTMVMLCGRVCPLLSGRCTRGGSRSWASSRASTPGPHYCWQASKRRQGSGWGGPGSW